MGRRKGSFGNSELNKAKLERMALLVFTGKGRKEIALLENLTPDRVSDIVNNDPVYLRSYRSLMDEARKRIVNRYVNLLLKAFKRHLKLLDSKDEGIRLNAIRETYNIHKMIFEKIDVISHLEGKESKESEGKLDDADGDYRINIDNPEKAKEAMQRLELMGRS